MSRSCLNKQKCNDLALRFAECLVSDLIVIRILYLSFQC